MTTRKHTPLPVSSSPLVAGTREGGIRVSITNQHGQRYRYRAQAVSLSMRKGELQVVENDARCFLWFDHCDLKVRDARSNLLFHLKTGSASNLPGAELVILAELAPPASTAKASRQTPSHLASAASLAG